MSIWAALTGVSNKRGSTMMRHPPAHSQAFTCGRGVPIQTETSLVREKTDLFHIEPYSCE